MSRKIYDPNPHRKEVEHTEDKIKLGVHRRLLSFLSVFQM